MKKLSYILFVFTLLMISAYSLPSTEVKVPSQKETETHSADVQKFVDTAEPKSIAESNVVPAVVAGETGYLFAPIGSTTTYLMNAEGTALQSWESSYRPALSVYLLENGNILRTGSVRSTVFTVGGMGGIVEEIAADSTVVWSFQYANDQVHLHHDIEELPDGNILMIAWEYKSQTEAIAAGRSANLISDGELWPDHIIEVDPSTNEIVWEWHVWDHLIQDVDPSKPNYGVVGEHPEKINLNYTNRQAGADWTHINSIDYNAELDQILLSVHGFSEFWVIDHNTSTVEAAGSVGDLLYRWGNPQTYDAGTSADQQLYAQHDAQWIPAEYPGGGNILVFNNGDRRTRPYSSVDEVVVPLNPDGSYTLANAPQSATWTYSADNFYADHISGAQRLPNGNTLICSGTDGRFFEVTSAGEIVWEYNYGNEVFRVTRYEAGFASLSNTDYFAQNPIVGDVGQNTSEQAQRENPGQNQSGRPDLAAAAAALGFTQQELRAALGGPPPDFAAAAATLGISQETLIGALGLPANRPRQQ